MGIVDFQDGANGDLPDLSDVLLPGERVAFVARGRVRNSRLQLPRIARWFILVTDRRLLCVRDGEATARQQLQIPLSHIEYAYQGGVVLSKVIIGLQRGRLLIMGLGRIAGAQLVSWLVEGARGRRGTRGGSPSRAAGSAMTVPPGAVPVAFDIAMRTRVEELESAVDHLTTQVRFLEELLQKRQQLRSGVGAVD